jgi:hypothetical protein|tara:strand:+ start:197 stop:463 length:267 start_codon:yes stop_codon:yes gene_type:complete
MELRTFDDEAFVVDGETFFHLWCCDCSLRHMVLIEPIGKAGEQFKKQNGKLAIGMLCDRESTEMAREKLNIKVLKDGVEIKRDEKTQT